MSTEHFVGPEDLAHFASRCASALFSAPKHHFQYPPSCSPDCWPADEIKRLNGEFLQGLRHSANVYALFVRGNELGPEWTVRYVGQRKARELRERMTQHLVQKNQRTGSMLERVKASVHQGYEIAVSLIAVEPESLRLFVEETIIATHKELLPWNTQGRAPARPKRDREAASV